MEERKPLLNTSVPLKQNAVSTASNLLGALVHGQRLNLPIGKYAIAVCNIFKIPLLAGESPYGDGD